MHHNGENGCDTTSSTTTSSNNDDRRGLKFITKCVFGYNLMRVSTYIVSCSGSFASRGESDVRIVYARIMASSHSPISFVRTDDDNDEEKGRLACNNCINASMAWMHVLYDRRTPSHYIRVAIGFLCNANFIMRLLSCLKLPLKKYFCIFLSSGQCMERQH